MAAPARASTRRPFPQPRAEATRSSPPPSAAAQTPGARLGNAVRVARCVHPGSEAYRPAGGDPRPSYRSTAPGTEVAATLPGAVRAPGSIGAWTKRSPPAPPDAAPAAALRVQARTGAGVATLFELRPEQPTCSPRAPLDANPRLRGEDPVVSAAQRDHDPLGACSADARDPGLVDQEALPGLTHRAGDARLRGPATEGADRDLLAVGERRRVHGWIADAVRRRDRAAAADLEPSGAAHRDAAAEG